MNLHEKPTEFAEAIQATAQYLKIRSEFIEKDYWVTYILRKLSLCDFKKEVIFKGGTSLSKAYNIVHRFSEDIDLVILGIDKLTGNQVKTKLKDIEKSIIDKNFTKDTSFKDSKGSKFRKTGYRYPRTLKKYDFGHSSETLILELNAFTYPSPIRVCKISCYIAEYLKNFDLSLIEEFELQSFDINVLDIKRTFVEKLLSVSRLSIDNSSNYLELTKKIRHFYDLYKLFQVDEIKVFIKSSEYKELLNKTIADDLSNHEFVDSWSVNTLHQANLFYKFDEVMNALEDTYNNNFVSLLYNETEAEFKKIKVVIKDILSQTEDIAINRK